MSTEWHGSKSQKFGGARRHIRHITEGNGDILSDVILGTGKKTGKRHIDPNPSKEWEWRPSLRKAELQSQNKKGKAEGIKKITAVPYIPKKRAERAHVYKPPTGHEQKLLGIATFNAPKSLDSNVKEAGVENMMGSKVRARLDGTMSSLAARGYSKVEHHPEYYKEGGVISGSTIATRAKTNANRKGETNLQTTIVDRPVNESRTTWKDRKRNEELTEEESMVHDLQEWERTILKEADPHYQDPDSDPDV